MYLLKSDCQSVWPLGRSLAGALPQSDQACAAGQDSNDRPGRSAYTGLCGSSAWGRVIGLHLLPFWDFSAASAFSAVRPVRGDAMCWAVPTRLVEIDGEVGKVEIGGTVREVGLQLIDDPRVGEYVLIHAGFAIHKVDEQEAAKTLELLEEMRQAISPPRAQRTQR